MLSARVKLQKTMNLQQLASLLLGQRTSYKINTVMRVGLKCVLIEIQSLMQLKNTAENVNERQMISSLAFSAHLTRLFPPT